MVQMQQVEMFFVPEFRVRFQVAGKKSNGKDKKIYWVERRDAPFEAAWYNVMPGKFYRTKQRAEDFVTKCARAVRTAKRGKK
jgi:hypothetical protein